MRVKGFDSSEYDNKKIKKFHVEFDVEEKELIKESNYFDESRGDLGIYNLVPPKYGDFSIGDMDRLGTFPIQTYLFDVALKDELRAWWWLNSE